MFIGNSYIIPAIRNPRMEPGFAFEFKKNEDSWFEASDNSVANYKGLAISCWIKLPDSFFVDIDPGPGPGPYPSNTETQHILDKYGFSGGLASGYRLILEKGVNQQSGSTFRRLVWQIADGEGNQIRTFVNINSLSGSTVYLITASAYVGSRSETRLFIKGRNNVLLTDANSLPKIVGQAGVPLVLGNANPTSTLLEYDGDLDEVAIWRDKEMNELITNEIFYWISNRDLNNLQHISPPNYWWRMGENASIVVVNNQDEYELPNQGSEGSNIVLTGTGTIDNRITPGLPNQLYA